LSPTSTPPRPGWGRRLDRFFPGVSNKILLRQMRHSRRYRTADDRVPD
jgi:hypothetical protein